MERKVNEILPETWGSSGGLGIGNQADAVVTSCWTDLGTRDPWSPKASVARKLL